MASDISNRLSQLIEEELARNTGRRRLAARLEEFKDVIQKARARGLSYRRISELLGQVGVTCSWFSVRSFCIQSLGEKPRTREKNPPVNERDFQVTFDD